MSIEIKVPVLPESVTDATVATWLKKPGDTVSRDENLVDLETDKVMLEVPAPEDGILEKIIKKEGSTVTADEVLAIFKPGTAATKSNAAASTAESSTAVSNDSQAVEVEKNKELDAVSPAVRRLLNENNLTANNIKGTGKDGRLTKQDVLDFMAAQSSTSQPATAPKTQATVTTQTTREEKRVPMTRMRARIAERLVQAQHQAAMLTTFNEVNLQQVMDLRSRYKDKFEKEYGVKLGFMSFFIKAATEALKRFPAVNASIDGDDVIYHGYYDIGVAVSTERGLVVPIVRDADQLNYADLEQSVMDYAIKARGGRISMEEMTGGTFTITNGGVFGSLLSTPILNPPQSAILGMHKIEQRAVVENGEIVIRPMMYVALSYDHRIVDGKDSVSFLATIKEFLENPGRSLLNI